MKTKLPFYSVLAILAFEAIFLATLMIQCLLNQ